jgi:hypothetical protein
VATKIYGASDDLIEFEGDLSGEVACSGTDDRERGVLVFLSDGTICDVKYGKADSAIWGIVILVRGILFDKLEPCHDEDAKPYSDVLHLKDGIKWGYAATEWERVK